MSIGNLGRKPVPGVPPYRSGWEAFDHLPREYKELAWDGPRCFIPINTNQPVAEMKAQMEELYAKDTAKVYGPDHPQAWKEHPHG